MERVPCALPPPNVILPPLPLVVLVSVLVMDVPYRLMPPMPVVPWPSLDASTMALPKVDRVALFSVVAKPTTMSAPAFRVMVPEVAAVLVPPALTLALLDGPTRNRLPAPASSLIFPTLAVVPVPVVLIASAVVGVSLMPP